MDKNIMREQFNNLYQIMKDSKKVEKMEIFGAVLKDMMNVFIDEFPDDAEDYLMTLNAVKWNNYLTREEADKILESMELQAQWSFEDFCNQVNSIEGRVDYEPYYNTYALWVVMNMIYSDSADTIAEILGESRDTISNTILSRAIYKLALDKLLDKNGLFNVRSYFKSCL